MSDSSSTAAPMRPASTVSWLKETLAVGLIFLGALVAYHNSFSGVFVFDDESSIAQNETLGSVWKALSPPRTGATVSGRPLVNLTLAVNHAWGGNRVGGYHAVNFAIHLLAALALYGIVRRTLTVPRPSVRDGREEAQILALAVALIWVVHPLETEAVTYIVQRAESLAGLMYLLTLYGFVRGVRSTRDRGWLAGSVLCCLLGMATKEVMVTAPFVVLLYDRTFVAGTFREAWRRRKNYYLGLAATWMLLIWLVKNAAGRGGTAGFSAGVPWWSYALTQSRAIVTYLKLSIWPAPLIFDYGDGLVRNPGEVGPQILLVILLLGGTAWALWRRPAAGFLGACFFLILAPSSSVIPVATQTMAEHRMYLPLAALVVAGVLILHAMLGRRGLLISFVVAVIFTGLTVRRNEDYRSELRLWEQTAANRPNNARAHFNFGWELFHAGKIEQATQQYERALQLKPDYAEAHINLGVALFTSGQVARAREHFEDALRLSRPGSTFSRDISNVTLHGDLGMILVQTGHPAEAIPHLREALRLKPDYPEAHNSLGSALAASGDWVGAMAEYREALRFKPDYPEAENNWGSALFSTGDATEAVTHYEAALRLKPDYADAHFNLANTFARSGRLDDAVFHYEATLRLKPENAGAQVNFGIALGLAGRWSEAISHFESALRLNPDSFEAQINLANTLARLDRIEEAVPHYESALRLRPDDALTREYLEKARALRR